ncbi:MAG TPA: lysophospholipid acyltransferase family protein [Anaerolineae bacterium]|nr:lysophospholipid acyltransferase family protein [Anaerolineae bacterium]
MKTLLYLVMVPVLYLYTWLLLRLNLQRGEPLPPGPRLLVANHPTTIDSFFVAWLAGGPACILITEDAFKVPLFGAYLRHAGHVPVVSGRGREAFTQAQAALEAGRTVIIFPEGDLSPREGLCQAHSGAARLALLTGVPVIPIGIYLPWEGIRFREALCGTRAVMSRWPVQTPYAITVGRPLHFRGDADDRTRVAEVTETLMQHIAALAQQSALRLRPADARGCAPVAPELAGQAGCSRPRAYSPGYTSPHGARS